MQGETSALPPLTPRRRLRAAGHAVEFGQKVQGYSVGDHYRPVQPDDEQDGSLPSVTKRGNSPRLNSPGQGGHLHSTGQPTGRSRAARTSFAKTPTAVPTASLSPTSATPSPTGQFASPRVAMLWAKSTNAVMSDTAEQKRKQARGQHAPAPHRPRARNSCIPPPDTVPTPLHSDHWASGGLRSRCNVPAMVNQHTIQLRSWRSQKSA
jgi:hypothetical protein